MFDDIKNSGKNVVTTLKAFSLSGQPSPEINNNYRLLSQTYSRPITEQDFRNMPKKIKMGFGRKEGLFSIKAEGEYIEIVFEYKDANIFKKYNIDPDKYYQGSNFLAYSVGEQSEYKNEMSPRSDYCIDKLERLEASRNGSRMREADLANLIRNLDGKDIVIYTGAGISNAGEASAWTMPQLMQELGFGENGESSSFIEMFFNQPEMLVDKVICFKEQLFSDCTTDAHKAIAEIVSLKPGLLVLTENIDLKHEAEGSRIFVCHMGKTPNDFDIVREKTRDIKLLITVGLSQDDRAVIAYMKKHNPDLKIVAFTLSPETTPKYVGSEDSILVGDCQETLPNTVSLIKDITAER